MRRLIALHLAAIFIITNHTTPLFGAAPKPSRSEAAAQFPKQISQIQIPQEFGQIESIHQASGPAVILIQDAHAIPDAQKNIASVVRHFQAAYGVSLVTMEGSASEWDFQFLKSFPDQKKLKELFERFREKAELTGVAEAMAFPSEGEKLRPLEFHGVEDWNLYEAGLSPFLESLRQEAEIRQALDPQIAALEKKKEAAFPPALLKVDRALAAFYRNELDLLSLMKALREIKPPQKGSSLSLLMAELEREGESNPRFERELLELAGRLRGRLGNGERISLNQKLQEFQTSQISAQAFGVILEELAAKARVPVQISNKLGTVVRREKKLRDIKGLQIFEELENYAASVKGSFLATEELRSLNRESERLELLSRAAALELTRGDWEKIKTTDHGPQTTEFQKLLEPHFEFYKNSEARDEAIFHNLMKRLNAERSTPNAAILVAGGFHTEGLRHRFEKEEISYLVVTPKILSIPEESRYRDLMLGNVSWRRHFRAENGRVNFYHAFVRGVRDELLGVKREETSSPRKRESAISDPPVKPGDDDTFHDPRLFKEWRDQILRDLADEGRLGEAQKYTRFLDEVNKPASQEDEALYQAWMANIDKFMADVTKLKEEGKLTEQAFYKLLNLGTRSAAPITSFGTGDADATILRTLAAHERASASIPRIAAPKTPALSEARETDRQAVSLPGPRPDKARAEARTSELPDFVRPVKRFDDFATEGGPTFAFNPDGNLLAYAAEDSTIRLYDTRMESYGTDLTGHKGRISSVQFSPDGNMLVSSGDDGIRWWNLEGERLGYYETSIPLEWDGTEADFEMRVESVNPGEVRWHPNSRYLSWMDRMTLNILDIENPEEVRKIQVGQEEFSRPGTSQSVTSFDLRPNGLTAAIGIMQGGGWGRDFVPDHLIRVIDLADGQTLAELEIKKSNVDNLGNYRADIETMLYLGDLIIAGYTDGTVRVWDLVEGRILATFYDNPFLPGQAFVRAGRGVFGYKKIVDPSEAFEEQEYPVRSLSLVGTGLLIWQGYTQWQGNPEQGYRSRTRSIKISDLVTGKKLGEIEWEDFSGQFAASPDGSKLVWADKDGLQLVELNTTQLIPQSEARVTAKEIRAKVQKGLSRAAKHVREHKVIYTILGGILLALIGAFFFAAPPEQAEPLVAPTPSVKGQQKTAELGKNLLKEAGAKFGTIEATPDRAKGTLHLKGEGKEGHYRINIPKGTDENPLRPNLKDNRAVIWYHNHGDEAYVRVKLVNKSGVPLAVNDKGKADGNILVALPMSPEGKPAKLMLPMKSLLISTTADNDVAGVELISPMGNVELVSFEVRPRSTNLLEGAALGNHVGILDENNLAEGKISFVIPKEGAAHLKLVFAGDQVVDFSKKDLDLEVSYRTVEDKGVTFKLQTHNRKEMPFAFNEKGKTDLPRIEVDLPAAPKGSKVVIPISKLLDPKAGNYELTGVTVVAPFGTNFEFTGIELRPAAKSEMRQLSRERMLWTTVTVLALSLILVLFSLVPDQVFGQAKKEKPLVLEFFDSKLPETKLKGIEIDEAGFKLQPSPKPSQVTFRVGLPGEEFKGVKVVEAKPIALPQSEDIWLVYKFEVLEAAKTTGSIKINIEVDFGEGTKPIKPFSERLILSTPDKKMGEWAFHFPDSFKKELQNAIKLNPDAKPRILGFTFSNYYSEAPVRLNSFRFETKEPYQIQVQMLLGDNDKSADPFFRVLTPANRKDAATRQLLGEVTDSLTRSKGRIVAVQTENMKILKAKFFERQAAVKTLAKAFAVGGKPPAWVLGNLDTALTIADEDVASFRKILANLPDATKAKLPNVWKEAFDEASKLQKLLKDTVAAKSEARETGRQAVSLLGPRPDQARAEARAVVPGAGLNIDGLIFALDGRLKKRGWLDEEERELLINVLREDPFFAIIYADDGKPIVPEGYNLVQHLRYTLQQLEVYFNANQFAELPGGVSHKFLRLTMLLHDAGKWEAVFVRQDPSLQHKITLQIIEQMRPVLKKLGLSDKEIELMKALVDGDPIGEYLSPRESEAPDLDKAVAELKRMHGMQKLLSPDEFFALLTIYFQIDASSYTSDAGHTYLEGPDGQRKEMGFLFVRPADADRDPETPSFLYHATEPRLQFHTNSDSPHEPGEIYRDYEQMYLGLREAVLAASEARTQISEDFLEDLEGRMTETEFKGGINSLFDQVQESGRLAKVQYGETSRRYEASAQLGFLDGGLETDMRRATRLIDILSRIIVHPKSADIRDSRLRPEKTLRQAAEEALELWMKDFVGRSLILITQLHNPVSFDSTLIGAVNVHVNDLIRWLTPSIERLLAYAPEERRNPDDNDALGRALAALEKNSSRFAGYIRNAAGYFTMDFPYHPLHVNFEQTAQKITERFVDPINKLRSQKIDYIELILTISPEDSAGNLAKFRSALWTARQRMEQIERGGFVIASNDSGTMNATLIGESELDKAIEQFYYQTLKRNVKTITIKLAPRNPKKAGEVEAAITEILRLFPELKRAASEARAVDLSQHVQQLASIPPAEFRQRADELFALIGQTTELAADQAGVIANPLGDSTDGLDERFVAAVQNALQFMAALTLVLGNPASDGIGDPKDRRETLESRSVIAFERWVQEVVAPMIRRLADFYDPSNAQHMPGLITALNELVYNHLLDALSNLVEFVDNLPDASSLVQDAVVKDLGQALQALMDRIGQTLQSPAVQQQTENEGLKIMLKELVVRLGEISDGISQLGKDDFLLTPMLELDEQESGVAAQPAVPQKGIAVLLTEQGDLQFYRNGIPYWDERHRGLVDLDYDFTWNYRDLNEIFRELGVSQYVFADALARLSGNNILPVDYYGIVIKNKLIEPKSREFARKDGQIKLDRETKQQLADHLTAILQAIPSSETRSLANLTRHFAPKGADVEAAQITVSEARQVYPEFEVRSFTELYDRMRAEVDRYFADRRAGNLTPAGDFMNRLVQAGVNSLFKGFEMNGVKGAGTVGIRLTAQNTSFAAAFLRVLKQVGEMRNVVIAAEDGVRPSAELSFLIKERGGMTQQVEDLSEPTEIIGDTSVASIASPTQIANVADSFSPVVLIGGENIKSDEVRLYAELLTVMAAFAEAWVRFGNSELTGEEIRDEVLRILQLENLPDFIVMNPNGPGLAVRGDSIEAHYQARLEAHQKASVAA